MQTTTIAFPRGADTGNNHSGLDASQDALKIVPLIEEELIIAEMIIELALSVRSEPVIEM